MNTNIKKTNNLMRVGLNKLNNIEQNLSNRTYEIISMMGDISDNEDIDNAPLNQSSKNLEILLQEFSKYVKNEIDSVNIRIKEAQKEN